MVYIAHGIGSWWDRELKKTKEFRRGLNKLNSNNNIKIGISSNGWQQECNSCDQIDNIKWFTKSKKCLMILHLDNWIIFKSKNYINMCIAS